VLRRNTLSQDYTWADWMQGRAELVMMVLSYQDLERANQGDD